MIAAAILAAVSVAFPAENAKLPNLSRCYVMGATDGAEAQVTVSGRPVAVSRSGAWATVVPVNPGRNEIWVSGRKRVFFVGPSVTNAPPAAKTVYQKLEYAASTAQPHPKGKRPFEATIVLDAGHGGSDLGAVSPHGLPEKDANLRLAKAVKGELEARGFKVVMTREDDTAIPLYDRPKTAHAAKADAFVSLHHNAPGYETDPSLCRYQSVYSWNPIGERLAKAIVAQMARQNDGVASKGALHANYAVTRNPEIPSCLVEADFITHPEGELAAWSVAHRARLAAAIADGIVDWIAGR